MGGRRGQRTTAAASCLSFHCVGPGLELTSACWAASAFICWALSRTWDFRSHRDGIKRIQSLLSSRKDCLAMKTSSEDARHSSLRTKAQEMTPESKCLHLLFWAITGHGARPGSKGEAQWTPWQWSQNSTHSYNIVEKQEVIKVIFIFENQKKDLLIETHYNNYEKYL